MAKKLSEDEIKWVLSVESSQVQQEIHKLNKDSKTLIATNKDLKKEMLNLVAAGKKESAEYRNLDAELKKNNQALDKNKQKVTELEKKVGLTALTMVQLKKQAKDLQRQLDNTSQAANPSEYEKLSQRLASVRSRMDELKTSGKNTQGVLQDTDSFIKKGSAAVFMGNIWTKAIELIGRGISKAKELISEGYKMAGVAQGVERAFNRIASPGLLSNLQIATKNTVNNLELMKTAVKADNFKIPLTELSSLLKFAQVRAQETGESVEYLTNSIVNGIGRKSPLILDNLGISTSRLNEALAKTPDFAKAVGNIVREELAKSGADIDTSVEKVQQRAALLENIQLSIGQRLKGAIDSVNNAWGGFLETISKWVEIPVSEKMKEEQRALNILTNSIIAASGRVEIRNGLIEELNRKYPTFLANLDQEALTNEQIAIRLKEVNSEYDARLRSQILNETTLAPLQKERIKLITDELKYTKLLTSAPDKYTFLSDSFKEAILSGDVLKMTMEDIDKELNQPEKFTRQEMKQARALKRWIEEIKEIQTRLPEVDKEMESIIDKINAFGAEPLTPHPPKEVPKSLLKDLEQALLLAKGMSEATEEEIIAKNKKIDTIEKEIARLKSLGVETKKVLSDAKSAMDVDLQNFENTHKEKMLLLKKQRLETNQAESEYNLQVLADDAKHYSERISKLEEYQKKASDPKLKASIDRQILESQTALLETQIRQDREAVNALKVNRDDLLRLEEESYKQQYTIIKKALSEQQITKEQHDVLILSLDSATAENRLKINQAHHDDVKNLELSSGDIKVEAIKEANAKVLDADLDAATKRANQQKALQDLVKDFKGEFKLTTVGEDTELQRKTLDAAYQARIEMAEKEGMDTTELTRAYEQAKTNILLEEQQKRNQVLQQYGLLSMQEQYEMELELLTQQREQGLLDEEEYQKAKSQIQINHLKKAFDYYKNLFSGAISALQDAELSNIDAKYDAEIERAQGNAEEVERLENEKEGKKLEVQKKYANVNFAIKASEIIANTAVSIVKALADLGPIAGPIAASLMGVTGAAQLASANAERKKIMSMTVGGASSGSSNTGKRVVTGKESGGKIDVIRAQDGKEFSADYDPNKRGFVDKPTVIVGEGPTGRSKEWVASNDALDNPTIAPIIHLMNESQERGEIRTVDMNQLMRQRLAGFASGGSISTPVAIPPAETTPGTNASVLFTTEDRQVIRAFITQIKAGVHAYVLRSELNKEIELDEKSKKIGSK